ncbi:O-antigen polymerase, partial [Bifidobacterium breve]
YLSAPMKNLDLAITHGIVHSDYWGQLSFKYLYPSFEKFNLVPVGSTYGAFPFLSFNGYFMGNVYTTFYALLVDFGFAGCLLAVAIMAAMSQCTYSVALCSRNSYSIAVILYAFISFQLFMSFFSSNFYQNIFNTGFIKFIIPIVLFKYYVSIKSPQENKLLS